jgi:hypothetical protein
MIPLLFIGDGPRDGAMMPAIVKTILGNEIRPQTRSWARLNRAGSGYDRKLLFAVAEARSQDLTGVVATVDADRSGPERITQMRAARERDRSRNLPVPIALGCAQPHGEAWLLDDPDAIREALGLPESHLLANVRKTNDPKAELEVAMRVCTLGEVRPLILMGAIAQRFLPGRCRHKEETGFRAFEDEVRREFRDHCAK